MPDISAGGSVNADEAAGTVVVVVEVVVDDIKFSLFDTSLPPQNEINSIKSEPNMRLIIKLSQSVCIL
jgi:nucleoside phosphorylase